MAKEVKIKITAQSLIQGAVSKAKASLQGLRNDAAKIGAGIGKAFRAVRGIMIGVAAGAAALGVTLKQAFKFETYTTQFKVLFRDLGEAKARVKELKEFSAQTPFQFGDLADASRTLEVFTGGVMGGTASLKLVGDAAAAVGQPVKDLSFWIGRAYASIASGKPFGEAAMRLQEMGVLTPEVRSKMEDLQKAGASNAEVWGLLQGRLEEFGGGMEEMSKTGDGLISTLKDNWTLALAAFGEEFMAVAKDDISALIEWLKKLQKDGSIKAWAAEMKEVLKGLGTVISGIGKGIGWIVDKVQTAGKVAGAVAGGLSLNAAMNKVADDEAREKVQARIDKAIAEDKASRKPDEDSTAQAKTDNTAIAEDLAKKQEALDAKRAEKQKQEDTKRRMKLTDEWLKADKKISDEKAKLEYEARKKALQEELADLKVKAAKSAELAKLGVQGWMDKIKREEQEADAAQAQKDRVQKLTEKQRRGIKLSKKDQEFMDVIKKMQEAEDKRIADKTAAEQAADRLRELDEKRNDRLEKMQKNLANIEKDLAPLLAMK